MPKDQRVRQRKRLDVRLCALASWLHDFYLSLVGTPGFSRTHCEAYLEREGGEARHEYEQSEWLHIDSEECWCNPYVYFEADNGNRVWVHKGNGDDLPPPSILAEAIADAIADR